MCSRDCINIWYSEARPHQTHAERSRWNRKCTQSLNKEKKRREIYKIILLRSFFFLSPICFFCLDLSASKPWHRSRALGEQKSLCVLSFSGPSLQPGSRVFTDIIVLFEGPSGVYFLSGFELCCLFSGPQAALQLSASVCFPLARPSSSRHGPVMILHGTPHTHPPFLFLTPKELCLLSLTNPT